MARIISLVVLLAILVVMGALFFRVMANILLPTFLAVLLVVMFGPVHRWFGARCKGRTRLSAALTTAAILLIVLLPLLLVLFQAVHESVLVYHKLNLRELDIHKISEPIVSMSNRMGLELSAAELQQNVMDRLRQWLTPMALGTTQFMGDFLVGGLVMIIALYYFLADGPAMVGSMARLLPLDPRYTQQLVEQFVTVSRAVVLATLLSAAIQGLLAGLGFYLAGFHSIFLFSVLAMLMAMVPFLGPPAVWVPACLWLYFYEDRATAAVVLAIYGTLIVCSVDNIVKPMVLHGRSNLHPLLALLSVLGGMQAMGLIGVFVGPMVVAFLQTLLNMLRDELVAMQSGPPATENQ